MIRSVEIGYGRCWKVMKFERAIQSMYLGSQACVRTGGKVSGCFPITQGVRQGCVTLPWLFNVFMDRIMREAKEMLQGGVQLTTTNVQLILFADDIVMVMEKKDDMQTNLGNEVRASQLAQASERVGSLIPASQQG